MTQTRTQTPLALYQRFLEALNTGDEAELSAVIAPDFTDHHPQFNITDLESYLAAVQAARGALQLSCELLDFVESGDKFVTRVRITGHHVGEAFGYAPTGRRVHWETNEIWRHSDGMLVERWAQEDLAGLQEQLSMAEANLAVVRKVSDAVNGHRYDDLDALFADTFVDHNAAWLVESLDALKGIIIDAHRGLDFVAHTDALYPAGEDKVVMHITFTGKHIAEFCGQPPTGKEVTWTSIEVYRLADGVVAERWVQADTAGLLRQLGVELP